MDIWLKCCKGLTLVRLIGCGMVCWGGEGNSVVVERDGLKVSVGLGKCLRNHGFISSVGWGCGWRAVRGGITGRIVRMRITADSRVKVCLRKMWSYFIEV